MYSSDMTQVCVCFSDRAYERRSAFASLMLSVRDHASAAATTMNGIQKSPA